MSLHNLEDDIRQHCLSLIFRTDITLIKINVSRQASTSEYNQMISMDYVGICREKVPRRRRWLLHIADEIGAKVGTAAIFPVPGRFRWRRFFRPTFALIECVFVLAARLFRPHRRLFFYCDDMNGCFIWVPVLTATSTGNFRCSGLVMSM